MGIVATSIEGKGQAVNVYTVEEFKKE